MYLKIRVGIINLFIFIGILILILGIIFNNFAIGFLVAFCSWMFSAIIASYFEERKDINGNSQGIKINLRHSITTFLVMTGFFVIFLGGFIFINEIKVMIFIAIDIWVLTGVFTSFFNDENKNCKLNSNVQGSFLANKVKIAQTAVNVASVTTVQENYEQKLDKEYKMSIENFCKNCGSKVARDAIFCDKCGSQQ